MTDITIPDASVTPITNHVVALNGAEMEAARIQVRAYLERQSLLTSSELAELNDALRAAQLANFKTSRIEAAIGRLRKRQRYLSHLTAAVAAGYSIVPNMPMTVFAVRVKRDQPLLQSSTGGSLRSAAWDIDQERGQLLEAGAGRYVSPDILTEHSSSQEDDGKGGKRVKHTLETTQYDAIDFPFAAAHASVMNATQEAMALKIFDRIGIVPETRPKGDPIILGQIIERHGQSERVVSCLIAWHIDLRTL
jgi:hypothetical protein